MTTETSVSLHGPYQLSRSTVVRTVTLTYPGVYVLSRDGRNAHYVGRSDRDVKGRLLDHTGSRSLSHRLVGELSNTGVGAMRLNRGWPVQLHRRLGDPQRGRLLS